MIKFTCENCNKEIKVTSDQSGKKGRCPQCKNVVVVPLFEISIPATRADVKEESASGLDVQKKGTVDFKCSMCGKVIEALESSRGKLKECPECGCYVEVPKREEEEVVESLPGVELGLKDEIPGRTMREKAAPGDYEPGLGHYLKSTKRTDKIEADFERKLPWLIDIFFYPTSSAGLFTLAIVIFGPAIMDLILMGIYFFNVGVLSQLIGLVLLIAFLLIRITLWLYGYWYFSVCIEESARGKTRAPEILTKDMGEDVFDIFVNMLRLVCCLLLCTGPALAYWWNTKVLNETFWILLAAGVFFLPMVLLRMVMFDSLGGLNPFAIVWSILKIFPRYCLVLLFFYLPMGLLVLMTKWVPMDLWGGRLILKAANMYLLLISAHVLGWFYYRNDDRLEWPV
jgi:predicted RNA-binding Zn-ribbon protein involved in translation (DUF1610 family)